MGQCYGPHLYLNDYSQLCQRWGGQQQKLIEVYGPSHPVCLFNVFSVADVFRWNFTSDTSASTRTRTYCICIPKIHSQVSSPDILSQNLSIFPLSNLYLIKINTPKLRFKTPFSISPFHWLGRATVPVTLTCRIWTQHWGFLKAEGTERLRPVPPPICFLHPHTGGPTLTHTHTQKHPNSK